MPTRACAGIWICFSPLAPRGDDPDVVWIPQQVEGPDDRPAHLKASLMPVSLSILFLNIQGRKGLSLFDHHAPPHRGEIAAYLRAVGKIFRFAPPIAWQLRLGFAATCALGAKLLPNPLLSLYSFSGPGS